MNGGDRRLLSAILLALLLLSGCTDTKALSRELGVDISTGETRNEFDSHGGFHGDGITYLELSFDTGAGRRLESEILSSRLWSLLPLSENLDQLAENAMPQEGDYESPTVAKRGYYCFIDRHNESADPHNDAEVLNRPSCNYTLAVYDTEKNMLYYVALDT